MKYLVFILLTLLLNSCDKEDFEPKLPVDGSSDSLTIATIDTLRVNSFHSKGVVTKNKGKKSLKKRNKRGYNR